MVQNISYASDLTALEALVLHTVPDFGRMGDGIINTNALLSFLKMKKRFNVLEGGLEFWHGVIDAANTNFKWQGNTDTMGAGLQDPAKRLAFAIKTFTGSVVINKLHEAQNKGRAAMRNWAKTLNKQADSTIKNGFNSGFWAATPGTDEPESVPSLISITPTAGTIGGQSRAGSLELQNGHYSTAVADIGSEAGISVLLQQRIENSIGANDMVDLIFMGSSRYAGLAAYLHTLLRYRPAEMKKQIGLESIMLNNATVTFENEQVSSDNNTINESYVYGINSNHMSFDLLRDGNFIWNPDGFERVGQTLSKALYFWVFCNLTTDLPKSHFVMSDVSVT